MLNELRDLARSLKKANITQEDWHSKFKTCPKAKAFRVYLNVDGTVARIEPMDGGTGDIRKWEANNGESFPVFNIPPLYEATEDIAKKKVAGINKKLKGNESISSDDIKEAIKICNCWDDKSFRNTETKVINSLGRTATDIKDMLGQVPEDFKAIADIIVRAGNVKFVNFLDALERLLIDGLSKGNIAFMEILFNKPVQLVLELSDGYEYPATHRKVQAWMNKRFLEMDTPGGVQTSASALDAFGEDAAGTDKQKYPEVKLPVLGQVILRSMFKDIPAQTRYGMIEAGSFPAGDKVRMEMKSALEWLKADERKGKTWCDISNKLLDLSNKRNRNKRLVLYSYPDEMPTNPPEMAGMFAGADEDGALFSAIAERVIVALQGIAKGHPDCAIRIFVLAKMDKARTKVLVSRRYTANHMIDSAEKWQAGCSNIPTIKIRQFGKEKGDTLWAEPLAPFPAELVWCLNTAWRIKREKANRKGEKKTVHGYSMNDALSLLLDTGPEVKRLALRAIDTIVRNSSPLVLAIGQENHSAGVFKVDPKHSKQTLLLPSILGLLLYKLDMKGGYMSSPAFLVGRFMSLADKLHLKYCEHVRKGSIPPQLVGNALMPTALEEPVKALSMLCQRILPYQAWANTLKEGEDIGLIKYFLKELGEVCDKLKELDMPSQSTDADKAQMLLGYLAWSEKAND